MNLRNFAAIVSLVLLAAPLAVAGWSAYRFLTFTASTPYELPVDLNSLQLYVGVILIGFLGFFLAGMCLDGLGMRPRWYLRSLTVIGILWLFYIPAGTLFGIGLLVYLAFKQRAQKRIASSNFPS